MSRVGTVAVVGKPNVGKSTLVNTIVGHKVSIVSDKVQTTRRRVLGIATGEGHQVVLVDTPGVHKPLHKLGATLNEAARQALYGVDAILAMADCSKMPAKEDEHVAALIKAAREGVAVPCVLCLNKMDQLKAENVERNYQAYLKLFETETAVMTSLRKKQNVDVLLGALVSCLPEGEPLYTEDEYTDQTLRAIAAEIVREKALSSTTKEVPHAIATVTESWEESGTLVRIGVALTVEREGQKAILIGKHGSQLKKIGTLARQELEQVTGKKVFLELFVKVREDWRQNPRILREMDYL